MIGPIRLTLIPKSPCQMLSARSVADDRIWRPEQWMGVGKFRLAVSVEIARTVHQCHHGLAERLAASQFCVLGLTPEQIGDELPGRLRMHRPVGHQEGSRARIEEGAAKPGSRFGTATCAC